MTGRAREDDDHQCDSLRGPTTPPVSDKIPKTMMPHTPQQTPQSAPLVVDAAGKNMHKTTKLVFPSGAVNGQRKRPRHT